MKKIFNYRPLLFFALFFAAGIYTAFACLKYGQTLFAVFLSLVILSILSLFFHFIKTKLPLPNKISSFLNIYRFRIISLAAASVAGFVLFNIAFGRFEENLALDGKTAEVQGNVIETYGTASGKYYFLMENAVLTTGGQTVNVEGKIFVYVNADYGEGLPKTGDMLFFTSKINASYIYEEGVINTYAYRNNILYNFYIDEEDYVCVQDKPSFFISIRKYIKETLYKCLRKENAAICYGLITGDSLLIDGELKQAFLDGGIAHIFSVSGLHIGVITFLMFFLFRKAGVKGIYQIIISFAALLFYSAVCGFTAPVVRSFLMAEICLVSAAFGKKYDPLSSISFSVIVILAFSPLMLFDAGFLLSVGSVGGILILGRRFEAFLKFLPRMLRKSLAVSVSAQIGVIPVLARFYGTIPVFSLFLNIAAIPLVSIAYITLFLLLIFYAISGAFSFLFFFPQGLIEIVKTLTVITASSQYVTAEAVPFGFGTLFFCAIAITLSGFAFLSIKKKVVVSVSCAVLFFASLILNSLPYGYNGTAFYGVYFQGGYFSLIRDNGKCYYVDYGGGAKGLGGYLAKKKITEVEAAIILCGDGAAENITLFKALGVKKIIMPYIADNGYTETIAENSGISIKYLLSAEEYIYENLKISAYFYKGKYYGGYVSAGSYGIVYSADYSAEALGYIVRNAENAQIVFSGGEYDTFDILYSPSAVITQNYVKRGASGNVYSSRALGNLIFCIENGKIKRVYD